MEKVLLWCSFLGHEVGLAACRLIRQPAFWGPVVVTLALGFGATGAVFTVLQDVVLNLLPYAEPGELVRLQTAVPGMGAGSTWNLAKAEYLYFRKTAKSLALNVDLL